MPPYTSRDEGGWQMTGLLKALLKNDAGFMAIEYGLIGAVGVALIGQLFSRF